MPYGARTFLPGLLRGGRLAHSVAEHTRFMAFCQKKNACPDFAHYTVMRLHVASESCCGPLRWLWRGVEYHDQ
ncbi:protein of unknown function [Acidithiobacillus ferrivorans]|uniref:Uncharacterized protein n=1 Tax=Acidithiobacillus ferrivorans TaxID=160808 RepID=A0A060UQ88_9PROT|nr:hypothetical protein AFERRI_100179 [Acidithiobacillus ferrivorans]SMH66948.1 protein of unknown function [Acidithiobacillus ferrivorans]